MIFKIEYLASQAIENPPFKIDRPDGSYRYIFFHFISQVTLEINGNIIIAPPGTCILYSPQTPQKFSVEANRLNHDYIDFTLHDDNFFKDVGIPLNSPFNPKLSTFISDSVSNILEEKKASAIGSKYQSEAKLIELFVTISRKIHHKNVYNSEKYTESIKMKFEEIRLNMYQKPDKTSVSSLAKSLGFSLSRFNELYKLYFGTTPIKDLTNARISRVEDLLKEGYSTKEIIKLIGFASEEYYYRWFKKNFKMTKEDYIKRNANND